MRAELELPPEESEARLAGAANLVCVEDERLDPVENDSAETAILTLFDEVDDVFATLPLFEMGPELIREAQTVVEPESVSEIVQELPDFAHAENGQLTIARALSLVAPTAKMNDRVDAVELREAESTDAVGAELNWAMMFRERSFDESVDENVNRSATSDFGVLTDVEAGFEWLEGVDFSNSFTALTTLNGPSKPEFVV